MNKLNLHIKAAFRDKSIIEDGCVFLRSGKSYRGKIFIVDENGRQKTSCTGSTLANEVILVVLKNEANVPYSVLIDQDAIESIIHYFLALPLPASTLDRPSLPAEQELFFNDLQE